MSFIIFIIALMGRFIFHILLFALGMYLLSLCITAVDWFLANNYWDSFGDTKIVEDLWLYRWSMDFLETLF